MNRLDPVERLRELHAADRVLLLPNAWDAMSAALIEEMHASAIASTSAGVAWACGFADGEALPRERLLDALRAIVAASGELPVSADVEAGYSADPEKVAAFARDLRAIGIAGINVEDGHDSPELLAAKIAAIKAALRADGDDIFVNARTDIYLRELLAAEDAVGETIARGRRYADAGADAFFVPALDVASIARVAEAVPLPLALLAVPNLPPASDLFALGVRRLSAGSGVAKLAYGAAREAAADFLRDGTVGPLFDRPLLEYAHANALLTQRRSPKGAAQT